MAKKEEPTKQAYICLVTISSLDGNERWYPGSKIMLTDEEAAVRLSLGNVAPLQGTTPPTDDVGPAIIVHTPEEASA